MYKLSLVLLRCVLYSFSSTALFHLFLTLILLICVASRKLYICEDSYSVLIESKLPSINGASYWPGRVAHPSVWAQMFIKPRVKPRHDSPLCQLPRGKLSSLGPCCFIPITVF